MAMTITYGIAGRTEEIIISGKMRAVTIITNMMLSHGCRYQNRMGGDRKMNIAYKRNEMYRELELFDGDVKIGEAEVDIDGKMLSRLTIYEPYQNNGYGTAIVKALIKDYSINCLWVNADNDRAIHVYEKCGFKKTKPTMYLMERDEI